MEYGSEGAPERFMPILLVPMDDRGLSILPTHRLLKEAPPGTPEDWRSALSGTFQVRPSSAATILEAMEETADTGREGIGFVFGKEVWLLVPRSDLDLNAYMPAEASDAWKWLDANLLHRVLLPALGYGQVEPTYTRSVHEAFSRIQSGEFSAVFLLNPPTLFSLQQITQGGEKMPHKSTYFYPKVLSGLVMWRIE
jgi:uncharacterized protein (DUF1015 family)